MATFHQSTVDALYVATAVLPPPRVRNCELPLAAMRAMSLQDLALHVMRVEEISRRNLAKDDVTLLHLVGGGDGVVGGQVVPARVGRPNAAGMGPQPLSLVPGAWAWLERPFGGAGSSCSRLGLEALAAGPWLLTFSQLPLLLETSSVVRCSKRIVLRIPRLMEQEK